MYVDDEKAPVVKRIFDEYILGHGFTEMARGLENDGIPKPGNARVWYPATVRAILANRMYTGEYGIFSIFYRFFISSIRKCGHPLSSVSYHPSGQENFQNFVNALWLT